MFGISGLMPALAEDTPVTTGLSMKISGFKIASWEAGADHRLDDDDRDRLNTTSTRTVVRSSTSRTSRIPAGNTAPASV